MTEKMKNYIGLTEQEIKDYDNIIEEDAYITYSEILNALNVLTKQLSDLADVVNYAVKHSK